MKKLFNKTFFNFLVGFLVLIMVSFTMVSFVGKYSATQAQNAEEVGTASAVQ